jgi:hypothetical protein
MKNTTVKKKPVAEIETLPKGLKRSGKLKAKKRASGLLSKAKKKLDPTKNPLRDLIGIADVEPFARKEDEHFTHVGMEFWVVP